MVWNGRLRRKNIINVLFWRRLKGGSRMRRKADGVHPMSRILRLWANWLCFTANESIIPDNSQLYNKWYLSLITSSSLAETSESTRRIDVAMRIGSRSWKEGSFRETKRKKNKLILKENEILSIDKEKIYIEGEYKS